MSSYASNNYKRCSATPQTSVRVIGLQHLHTAEHMHTAEARAMRRWESALHAAQSMTYIRPGLGTRPVSYLERGRFFFWEPKSPATLSGLLEARRKKVRRRLPASQKIMTEAWPDFYFTKAEKKIRPLLCQPEWLEKSGHASRPEKPRIP